MPGGIIQIATYGSQDIYLTGTPQITFFKIVYRRHTNFAIESIPQQFIGNVNFGSDMSVVVDKIGDLMHKTYLEIILPDVNLLKPVCYHRINMVAAQSQFDSVRTFYNFFCEYIFENLNIAKQLNLLLQTANVSFEEIVLIMTNLQFLSKLHLTYDRLLAYIASDNFDCCLGSKQNIIQSMKEINIDILFRSNDCVIDCEFPLTKRAKMLCLVSEQLGCRIRNVYMPIYRLMLEKECIVKEFRSNCYTERYRCAWVEEIGHAIIDQIEVKIGPHMIDRHTGDWFILYNKIFLSEYQ